MTDQGSTRERTSWASRRVADPVSRAFWVDGAAAGLRVGLDLVFTAAAAVAAALAAAALTVSAACRPAWDGLRFFVFVVLPNGDLGLDFSSGRGEAALAGCGLLATTRPGICTVEP
ncbi:MAG TPA: hypothetical protein VN695_06695 [Streptosporangiaceae bacterium]|nr:hypothetical protein [Streptosporangiaceae bacterium]